MAFYDDLARDPKNEKEFWTIIEETFVQVEGALTAYPTETREEALAEPPQSLWSMRARVRERADTSIFRPAVRTVPASAGFRTDLTAVDTSTTYPRLRDGTDAQWGSFDEPIAKEVVNGISR